MFQSENNLLALAADAAYRVQPLLDEMLKTSAESAGWPKNIVETMSVAFDGASLIVDYPDQYAAEIDDLEYGKPFGLPNPVIRPFTYRAQAVVSSVLTDVTLDDVIEMEEVF